MNDGGPITIPPGSDVSIAEDGAVMVRDPANPEAPPQQIDRLKLANWRGSDIEWARISRRRGVNSRR